MNNALIQLKQRHLSGTSGGMVSVCSAHPLVLQSAMEMALEEKLPLLIEATASQVNQYGGYTGMTPLGFSTAVKQLAVDVGLPEDGVLIGADHLGPHVWKNEPATSAMEKAQELVRQCVQAGFVKIHLDTAIGCAGDPDEGPAIEVTAQRAAWLCYTAETTHKKMKASRQLLYVIGDDVPVPGGGMAAVQDVPVTDPELMMMAVDHYAQAFNRAGLESALDRVLAVVVQPGVDFGDQVISPYRQQRALNLSRAHGRLPGIMTFEIHSTDYQSPEALRQMVKDHFMLLKVGPCLTFALRKTLYALADIEADLPNIGSPSNLTQVMEDLMMAHPRHWQSHYRGSPENNKHLRCHSLRDRIRYYWAFPEAKAAVERLFKNLQRPLPPALLNHYLPELSPEIMRCGAETDPEAIVRCAIKKELMPYVTACR